jgi:hypothetical protein
MLTDQRSYRDEGSQVGEFARPNSGNLAELLGRIESSMIRSPIQDVLSEHRADTWQRVELLCCGGIQVDQAAGAGYAGAGTGCARGLGWGQPDRNLFTVYQLSSEVRR